MSDTRDPDVRKRADPARDPLLGAVLAGRYRVIRRIAEGGMGAVYEAEQTALQRKVAIKCLHAHLAKDEEIVARFRREALATTAIGHPHIIEVLDLGEMEDGTLFMVLELLTGRDLARALKDEGPFPVGRAARILAQVADGVAAAHDKGIVHRDLKPENIFLIDRAGDPDFVKVLDFGVSKIRAAIEGTDSHTRTGTALGTPYYMAPEQAQGRRDVDHRADVYALGVILFRILTGHHPFDDESYPMLVLRICTEPPPLITTWRSDVPRELIALGERMLSKDAGDRPASMDEVRAALERFVGLEAPVALTGAPAPISAAPGVLERRGATGRDHSPSAHARTQAATPAIPNRSDEEDDEVAETASRVVPQRSSAPMMAAVGLLALATLGVVAWAIAGNDSPAADRPQEVDLPTPREPIVRAFAPTPSDSRGWAWINPRPRAMPTWNAVHAGGPGLIAMVGQDGAAARFLNGPLVTWRSGTRSTLRAVAWISTEEALAAGDDGVIVRLTPRGPVAIETDGAPTLRAIAVISGTEALIAGDGGTLLRVSGSRVTQIALGTDAAILALHERGDRTWAAGERGTIVRLEGTELVREAINTGVTLRAIGGCERGDLYAAGDQGTLIRRGPDGGWQNVRTDVDRGEMLTAITCDRGRAAIVGNRGSVILASGGRTVRLPSDFERAWQGVAGARDETTWIVGSGGRLATIEEDHVQTRTDGPAVPLRDIGAIGGAIVAVGEWGRIVREQEHGFVEGASPTDAALAAIASIDETRLIAVGDLGAIVEVRWDGARSLPSPTDASLRDVLVAADGRVLAVGTNGTLLRGMPESLTASRVAEAGDLWAITGTADDALAVGSTEGGAGAMVAHVTAGGAARWPCDAGVSLRGIVRTPVGALAVGERGVIVRVEESGCVREHEGGPTLDAITIGPDGRPLAVGEDGAAWSRGDDGTWTAVEIELGGNHARGARRLGRHVYIVGTGGTIVRRIVADGT